METYLTPVKDIERKWYVVDAQGMVLGRLEILSVLLLLIPSFYR